MIVQITYNSCARARITDQNIAEITARSLPNNLAKGLTSYMYYDDWRFLHVLEGRSPQVAHMMKQIIDSPLHHSVKVRLMNRNHVRDFQGWHFGTLAATDPELCRILKNMGFRDLFQANVLDAIKVLKRTAGRKYRNMSPLEKQTLSDPRRSKISKAKPSITEEMLDLHG